MTPFQLLFVPLSATYLEAANDLSIIQLIRNDLWLCLHKSQKNFCKFWLLHLNIYNKYWTRKNVLILAHKIELTVF